ncbi:MAG: helix-turn-helix transcriptional regulator [Bacteroidales bacterium]|nr:helix-turn-helix transcriptional regulator [Bacteroidales bacterium]
MITINLDIVLATRRMTLSELSEKVDVNLTNLSILKTGKARAIRFTTLDAICKVLNCRPGDILDYQPDPEGLEIIEE